MPLGRSTYDQAHLNGEIAELTLGAHLMEAHTTYTIRCPNWNQLSARGRVEYVPPMFMPWLSMVCIRMTSNI